MAKEHGPVEGRDKKQINFVLAHFLVNDYFCIICAFLCLISLLIAILSDAYLPIRIALPILFFAPIAVKLVLFFRLRHTLFHSPSATVVVNHPKASVKFVKIPRRGITFKGLVIEGEVDGKDRRLFEYPLRGDCTYYERQASAISRKDSFAFRIIEGTDLIDAFLPRQKLAKAKKSRKLYKLLGDESKRLFHYEPHFVSEDDLSVYLQKQEGYDELYFANDKEEYVLLLLNESEMGKTIGLGGEVFLQANKAIAKLKELGFEKDGGFNLLATFRHVDARYFDGELKSVKAR